MATENAGMSDLKKTVTYATDSGSYAVSKDGRFESARFAFHFEHANEYGHSRVSSTLTVEFLPFTYTLSNAQYLIRQLRKAVDDFEAAVEAATKESVGCQKEEE